MSEGLTRDYQIGDEIGRGCFGIVRRCSSTATGDLFAVKSVDKRLLADAVDRECAAREPKAHLAVSAAGGSPRVTELFSVYEDDEWIHLVLELCDGGDLSGRIAARGGAPVPEPEAAAVVAELAEAVAACHRRGVAHRDVKPENVLFDAWGRMKLADFGSAEFFERAPGGGGGGGGATMSGVVGTPQYVAPEVVMGRDYGEKVDVWSVGVVMYELISGGLRPFRGETAAETFEAVARGNVRFPAILFAGVSPEAKDLMRRMLCKDAARRFSIDQVLVHPWITSGGHHCDAALPAPK